MTFRENFKFGHDTFKKNVDFNQVFSRILTKIEIFGNLDQNRDVSNKIEVFRKLCPNLKFSRILAVFRKFCPKSIWLTGDQESLEWLNLNVMDIWFI